MTQVVNAYFTWDFPSFDISLIESRGRTTTLAKAATYMRAVGQVVCQGRAKESVLVVHLSQGGSFLREGFLLVLGKLRRRATVAQLHGSGFVAYANRRPWLVRTVLRAATGIHALSEASAEAARSLAPTARVVVIPNAVSTGEFTEKENLMVFAGAVGERKGIDVLLTAWKGGANAPGWKLLVAGPLDGSIDSTQLDSENIEYLGPLDHGELMRILARSRIAVLPSRDEAMPMFLLEAMAHGNALLSTNVGGIPSVVDADVGLLVDPGNAEQLANGIKSMTQNAIDLTLKQEKSFMRHTQQYSAAAVIPRLSKFWNAVLKDNG
ncbi:glycosyltransferase family 4 protein [Nesterenkonia sp. E16_7]|uniref:glycosyltransferase family 4 protein n=1 Tax=unclassified Nesterenkonia TaxID=2629769 RepID=UPI001A92D45A|nr:MULTISPECIES: glycosyltransferase family 4 protein [unclassified Nesterenkonia]MBO0594582.1 glycosyltransferase family 4 protein [Nesterenkonia sp. E16_10]MBO0599775.1 glycosyltransferase family 4 protein [Nesterenkonia sp. E16_7]